MNHAGLTFDTVVRIVTLSTEINLTLNALVRNIEAKVCFATGTECFIFTAGATGWTQFAFKCSIEEESSLADGAVGWRRTIGTIHWTGETCRVSKGKPNLANGTIGRRCTIGTIRATLNAHTIHNDKSLNTFLAPSCTAVLAG